MVGIVVAVFFLPTLWLMGLRVEATDSGVPTVSLAELQTKFRTVRYRMIREQEEELRAPPLELLCSPGLDGGRL